MPKLLFFRGQRAVVRRSRRKHGLHQRRWPPLYYLVDIQNTKAIVRTMIMPQESKLLSLTLRRIRRNEEAYTKRPMPSMKYVNSRFPGSPLGSRSFSKYPSCVWLRRPPATDKYMFDKDISRWRKIYIRGSWVIRPTRLATHTDTHPVLDRSEYV